MFAYTLGLLVVALPLPFAVLIASEQVNCVVFHPECTGDIIRPVLLSFVHLNCALMDQYSAARRIQESLQKVWSKGIQSKVTGISPSFLEDLKRVFLGLSLCLEICSQKS